MTEIGFWGQLTHVMLSLLFWSAISFCTCTLCICICAFYICLCALCFCSVIFLSVLCMCLIYVYHCDPSLSRCYLVTVLSLTLICFCRYGVCLFVINLCLRALFVSMLYSVSRALCAFPWFWSAYDVCMVVPRLGMLMGE